MNLICEKLPGKNDFYHFKVPAKFLIVNLKCFHRIGESISLYISAEPENIFTEVRGKGQLDFSKFLVQ